MKICSSCKKEKEFSEFSKCKRAKSGLQSQCKACHKQYCKQYRAENPEYFKQYRAENAEQLKQYQKQFYAENAEQLKQCHKQYIAENPEVKAKCDKKYKFKYPEKRKATSKANYNLPSRDGYHRHHWSYNEEHWLDIIYVNASMHNYYHTHMEYDSTHMVYRIKSTGELLDTRERHEAYLNILNIKIKEVA